MDTPTIVALVALGGTIITAFFTFRSSSRATDVNSRAAELRLRAAEAPDGKPPRAPTSPKTKTWKPGTPKDPKKK